MRKTDGLMAGIGRLRGLVVLLGLLTLGAVDSSAHRAANVCDPCSFSRQSLVATQNVCAPCTFPRGAV